MPTPRPQTLEQVKTLLRRDLKLGDIDIADDMLFFGSDADLDSLDILLLMTSIEKQFKVKIPSEAMGKQVFANVSTLAAFIDEHMPSGEAAPAHFGAPSSAELLQYLPHGEPFRFVSELIRVTPGESGEGAWTPRGDEAFFAGHFPGRPIVPGVLIAEALAQLSGIVAFSAASGPAAVAASGGVLAHVDVRFERAVAPPTRIILRSKLLGAMGDLRQFEVSAEADNVQIARGTLALSRSAG